MTDILELIERVDALSIEFGDEELWRRNAEFDRRFAQEERRASRMVAVLVILGALIPIATIFLLRGHP